VHQQRDALVTLLLERGAEPYDSQVVYNIDVAELLIARGAEADPTVRDPQGVTAADRVERNAMYKVAAMLRKRENP
jgi:hypothetical protein